MEDVDSANLGSASHFESAPAPPTDPSRGSVSPHRQPTPRAIAAQASNPDAAASAMGHWAEVDAGPRGQALPSELRNRFEASLGADLSGVRVHTDERAASSAAAMNARAYAIGNDVFLGAGEYDPSTHDGALLLAHEVAHTVQQRGAAGETREPQAKLSVSSVGDDAEVEADAAAEAMVAGRETRVAAKGRGDVVHRQAREQGVGQSVRHRACVEDNLQGVAPPTNVPEWGLIEEPDLDFGTMARELQHSFRALGASVPVPSEDSIADALRARINRSTNFARGVSFSVAAQGQEWSYSPVDYQVRVRFQSAGPAEFQGDSHASMSDARTRLGHNGRVDTRGGAGGIAANVGPVNLGASGHMGSTTASGSMDTTATARTGNTAFRHWRMNLVANVSWAPRLDGAAAEQWRFTRVGGIGSILFERTGPRSPCEVLNDSVYASTSPVQAPAAPAPLLAAPTPVLPTAPTAPALPSAPDRPAPPSPAAAAPSPAAAAPSPAAAAPSPAAEPRPVQEQARERVDRIVREMRANRR